MILRAYSIYDLKALQYHPPFFASTNGAAVRSLADLASDTNTTIGRHPADYMLFCVGQYDDQKGQLIPCVPLEHVVDAISLVKNQQTHLFPIEAAGDPAAVKSNG